MNLFRKKYFFTQFILCLFIICIYILSTKQGLHFCINSAIRWIPALTVSKAEGDWSRCILQDVRYEGVNFKIKIKKLQLGLSVNIFKNPQISINRLILDNVNIIEHSGPHSFSVNFNKLVGAASYKITSLTILPTHVQGLTVNVPKQKILDIGHKLQQVNAVKIDSYLSSIQLSNFKYVCIPIHIKKLTGDHWSLPGNLFNKINEIQLSANLSQTQLTINNLTIHTPKIFFDSKGQLSLKDCCPITLDAKGQVNSCSSQNIQWQVQCAGNLSNVVKLNFATSGIVDLKVASEVCFNQNNIPVKWTIHNGNVKCYFAKTRITVHELKLIMMGDISSYQIWCNTQLKKNNDSFSQIILQGNGNRKQFKVDKLQYIGADEKIFLQGVVQLQKFWNNSCYNKAYLPAITKQNAVTERRQKTDKINFLHTQNWHISMPTFHLTGTINQHPLNIHGYSKYSSGYAPIQFNLNALIGINLFSFQFNLNRPLNITCTVDAPKMGGIINGLSGSMRGICHFSGTLYRPLLKARLFIDNFQWQQFSMQRFIINGQIHTNSLVSGKFDLFLQQLKTPKINIKHLKCNIQGREYEHYLRLEVVEKSCSIALTLLGNLDRSSGLWRGVLNKACFNTAFGKWLPDKNINIVYCHPRHYLKIDAHAWCNSQAKLQISKLIYDQRIFYSTLNLQQLDLSTFRLLLDHKIELNGLITGTGNISWSPDKRYRQINLALSGKQITLTDLNNHQKTSANSAQINIDFNHDKAILRGSLMAQGKKILNADIRIDKLAGERSLSGNCCISIPNLFSLIPVLVVYESKANSAMHGNLHFSGTIQQPKIFGNLHLSKISLPNLLSTEKVINNAVHITCDGSKLHFCGEIRNKKGGLCALRGNMFWKDWYTWGGNWHISSDKLLIYCSPELYAQVTSDLQIKASPKQLKLSGKLYVTKARCIITHVAEAVNVSEHEVLLGSQLQLSHVSPNQIFLINNVKLTLGDEVKLNGYGINGFLNGELNIVSTQQSIALYGAINLKQATFCTYGQKLTISRGKILFAGPAKQAMLDIEAIRNPDETENHVIVGLLISGLVKQPNLLIFSKPNLPKNIAINYLLSGHKQLQDDSGQLATQIILNMLQDAKNSRIAKINQIFSHLENNFGLNRLSLYSVPSSGDQDVVISGYWLRHLQFKYGFNSLTWMLRLRVLSHVYLAWFHEPGEVVELLYRNEF